MQEDDDDMVPEKYSWNQNASVAVDKSEEDEQCNQEEDKVEEEEEVEDELEDDNYVSKKVQSQ